MKLHRRSPLNHGHVVGIDDAHPVLTSISQGARPVPYLLSSVEAPSLRCDLDHVRCDMDHVRSDLDHVTKSQLSHVIHSLAVRGQASQHSITKIMTFGKHDYDRELNHDPVNVLQEVTHTLVPTVTHVTTTTLSEQGFTRSPTLTVVEHSLVGVSSHGLSRQSQVTLSRESVPKTPFAGNHDQTHNNHILPTFPEQDKNGLLRHSPATHTLVQKVSTLTHDPDPVITHDVSVTHITDSAILTHKLPHIPEHENVFRTHYGGFGVGIDFGGHGSGHGFYV